MPIQPTYPGVYVQEIPSGVHTITGVSTSVTAFVGHALSGPVNLATHILSFADYERNFGGLASYSQMSYAVQQFFLNGGSDAWVVRIISQSAGTDTVVVNDGSGNPVLQVSALSPGETDRTTSVFIDGETPKGSTFNMTVVSAAKTQSSSLAGASKDIIVETYSNLSMDPTNSKYAVSQVNGVSQYVTVTNLPAPGATTPNTALPAPTPTQPKPAPSTPLSNHGALVSGNITADITKLPHRATTGTNATQASQSLRITLDGTTPYTITPKPASGNSFKDINDLAQAIQNAVIALNPGNAAFSGFTCTASGTTLTLTSGSYGGNSSVYVQPLFGDTLADDLQLSTGKGNQVNATVSLTLTGAGADGISSGEEFDLYIGNRANFEGIYALDKVDLFNLLVLSGVSDTSILSYAAAYCEERGSFIIVDPPQGQTPNDMYTAITTTLLSIKTEYGAIYYPWISLPDPLNQGAITSFPPSGTIAGLYAREDSNRGVWKAPAGTETTLLGVQGFEYLLNDGENGILNPQGVNCLRAFAAYGFVCWGARTLLGSDAAASEYKYVPVRRTALYLEESLLRGLQWAVFEPNDEPLWAQIRLNVGAFMHTLFVKGAFQGQTPNDAYFVKCDKETTTQNDIDLGIVNVIVGFAPLKPAEFVIISIQQIAGQLQV